MYTFYYKFIQENSKCVSENNSEAHDNFVALIPITDYSCFDSTFLSSTSSRLPYHHTSSTPSSLTWKKP